MQRNLVFAISVLAAACATTKSKVSSPPSPTAKECGKGDQTIYVIDGKPVSCTAAMTLPTDRIASVDVLKGAAASTLYGASPSGGVVVIQTKPKS